jgi:hypothetical protein
VNITVLVPPESEKVVFRVMSVWQCVWVGLGDGVRSVLWITRTKPSLSKVRLCYLRLG